MLKKIGILLIITLAVAMLSNAAWGQDATSSATTANSGSSQTKTVEGPSIRLEPPRIELGELEIGKLKEDDGKVSFIVWNDGNKPLIMNMVTGCCGTDIKDYTKGPILPGKSGKIDVFFRIEPKPKAIDRTVTIVSNAANSPELQGKIVGTVVTDKEKGRVRL